MSVLIRGMTMPKNCLECVFYRTTDPFYDYCMISSVEPKGYVPNDCPLIQVPDHGRLIDADEVQKQWYQLHFDRKLSDGTLAYWNFVLSNAPTVIEVEGEET